MDPDRQIRLLIPPFFFFASLLLGTLLTDNPLRHWASSASGEQLVAIGGAIAASLLPVGFVISSITFLLLRIAFLPSGRSVETDLSPAALDAVWPKLGTTLAPDSRHTLFAAVTLDHELLSPGLHSWIMRTWNVFTISAQACVALGLAHVVAWQLGLKGVARWYAASIIVSALLALNAVVAWRRVMDMLEFQAYRQSNGASGCRPTEATQALQSDQCLPSQDSSILPSA